MIIECSMVSLAAGRHPDASRDFEDVTELTVHMGPRVDCEALANALREAFGPADYVVGGRVLSGVSPAHGHLVNGCVIVRVTTGWRGGSDSSSLGAREDAPNQDSAALLVVSGPASGVLLPVTRGVHALGRNAHLRIPDASISRLHATIRLDESAITLERSSGAGQLCVDGRPVQRASIHTGSVIQMGQSELMFLSTARISPGRRCDVGLAEQLMEDGDSSPSHPGLSSLLMMLSSLAGGVFFALYSGMWAFLLLSVLGAIPYLFQARGHASGKSGRKGSARRRNTASAAIAPRAPGLGLVLHSAPGDEEPDLSGDQVGMHESLQTPHGHAVAVDGPQTFRLGRMVGPERTSAARRLRRGKTGSVRLHGRENRKGRPDEESVCGRVVLHPMDQTLHLEGPPSHVAGLVSSLVAQSMHWPAAPAWSVQDPGGLLPPALRFLPGVSFSQEGAPSADPAGTPALRIVLSTSTEKPGQALARVSGQIDHHGSDPLTRWPHHGATGMKPGAQTTGPALMTLRSSDATYAPLTAPIPPSPSADPEGQRVARGQATTHAASAAVLTPDLADRNSLERFCRRWASRAGGQPDPWQAAAADRGPAVSAMAGPGRAVSGKAIPSEDPGLAFHLPYTAGAVAGRWHRPALTPLRIPLGTESTGPFLLDLAADGPHFLVAGTTGSGKSEFLRSLVLGMALSCAPANLTLILADFKGGAAFATLSELPHVQASITDLAAGELDRVLRSLRAEVTFREELFRQCEVSDWNSYHQLRSASQESGKQAPDMPELPRVVIVVDEFRMLLDLVPDALNELVRLAAIGRSLGFHLILATQRALGAVTGDIRANIGCTIALRVQSEVESLDLIGTSDAARLPRSRPGLAYVLTSDDVAHLVQCANSRTENSTSVIISLWPPGNRQPPRTAEPASSSDTNSIRSQATDLVAECVQTLRALPGFARAPRIVAPVLEEWSGRPGKELALVDLPDEQRQSVLFTGKSALFGVGGAPEEVVRTAMALGPGEHSGIQPQNVVIDPDGAVAASGCSLPPSWLVFTDAAEGIEHLKTRLKGPSGGQSCARPESGQGPALIITDWTAFASRLRQGPDYLLEQDLLSHFRSLGPTDAPVIIGGNDSFVESTLFTTMPVKILCQGARVVGRTLEQAITSLPRGKNNHVLLSAATLPPGFHRSVLPSER